MACSLTKVNSSVSFPDQLKRFPNPASIVAQIGDEFFLHLSQVPLSKHQVTADRYDLDELDLVADNSTMEVTIRDQFAQIRRTETQVWHGGEWHLVSAVDYTYNLSNQLVRRESTNGAIYEAAYSGEQILWEKDEQGVKVTYDSRDAAGRVLASTREGVTDVVDDLTTHYTHDAASHVLETRVGQGTDAIVTTQTYDDAGRLSTETPAGLGTIQYSYNPATRKKTVTAPDTGTRIETTYADGRMATVTGTAVVAQSFDYAVDGNKFLTRVDTVSSSRWQKTWQDWLRRTTKTARPGFSGTSQPDMEEENFYNETTGLREKTTRTGYAPTRYEYDEMANVKRSGLDLGDDGLVLVSGDRIVDTDQTFEQDGNDNWWLRTETWGYPYRGVPGHDDDERVRTGLMRVQLSGLSDACRSRVETTDIEDQTSVVVVSGDRDTKEVTTTITGPGLAHAQVTVAYNGLETDTTTPDELTYTKTYDSLGRLYQSTKPRNEITTTFTYKQGTAILETVKDGASNGTMYTYDNMGRRTVVEDALEHHTRLGYNLRGQLLHQWGSGTMPVAYAYNDYGERTGMRTFQVAPSVFDAEEWPSGYDVPPYVEGSPVAGVTHWAYDAPSGQLHAKIDAAGMATVYHYDERGQASYRSWVRRRLNSGLDSTNPDSAVITTYGYDDDTGELKDITYNDSTPGHVEPLPTAPISYTYTRSGQIATMHDAIGLRRFDFEPAAPWRLTSEILPAAFYHDRVLTQLYETTTSTSGSYGDYIRGQIKGRARGYTLGVMDSPISDLRQETTYSNAGRVVGMTTQSGSDPARDFVYTYTPNSALLSGYCTGAAWCHRRG